MLKKIFLFTTALIMSAIRVMAQDTAVNFSQNLTGHTAAVECVAYSKDGKYLASGSWDNTVRVYTVDSNGYPKFLRTLTGHMGAVTAIAFNSASTLIATGSKDFTVRVYDLTTGALVFAARDNKETISSLAFDTENKFLFSGSFDGTIRAYDVVNFENNRTEKSIPYGVKINDILLSSAKGSFIVASSKTSFEQVNGKKQVMRTFSGHTAGVNSLDLSPNKKIIASGSDDKTIILWDVLTAKEIKRLKGHGWKVTSVQFSTDGKYLLSTCNNGEVKLWDIEAGKCMTNIQPMGNNARMAAFSSDQSQIAVASLQNGPMFGVSMYTTPIKIKPVVKKVIKNAKDGKDVKVSDSKTSQKSNSNEALKNKSNPAVNKKQK